MMRKIKLNLFKILRFLGIFHLTLWLTRKKLRIFCYHGFSLEDEHLFMPGLFMHIKTFKHRLKLINKYNIQILDLTTALDLNYNNKITTPCAVLTFDDGFISTFQQAFPLLKEHSMPATLYLTTYYQTKQTPIFRLAIQYLFWKCPPSQHQLYQLVPNINFTTNQEDNKWRIIEYGEQHLKEPERQQLFNQLAKLCSFELTMAQQDKFMRLENDHNIQQAIQNNFSIEYHTHRHRFPQDHAGCLQELQDNKMYIEKITHTSPQHFCYPSGKWLEHHPQILQSQDIKSATTCDPGLVTPDTNPLLLPRFLDSDIKKAIEFEADLCGLTYYILKIKHLLGIDTRTY